MQTVGIKYAGSKLKLLPQILNIIAEVKPKTVFRCFSGTTRVSQALAQSGYAVISNDTAPFSKVFATAALLNKKPAAYYQSFINRLNGLDDINGWYSQNYGGLNIDGKSIGADGLKKPFQLHNTVKLDAILLELDNYQFESEIERDTILACVILALDKVDSTLGHQVSYLKEWSKRSFNQFKIEFPFTIVEGQHKVLQQDANTITDEIDLAYLDPPYCSANVKMPSSRVRYAAYYHIYNTICLGDKPELFGKAKRRLDSSDKISYSAYEDFKGTAAQDRLFELFSNLNTKHILLSYNDNGIIKLDDLVSHIKFNYKLLSITKLGYKKHVMANMVWTNEWKIDSANNEYLILFEK